MNQIRSPQDEITNLTFTAPEVYGPMYGDRADVWTAGIVLYMLLCGKPPFVAKTVLEMRCLINVQPVTFDKPQKTWAKISDDAKDLIIKMLDKNTDSRLSAS